MTAAHGERERGEKKRKKSQGASEGNQKMSSKTTKERITQLSHLGSFVVGVVLVQE